MAQVKPVLRWWWVLCLWVLPVVIYGDTVFAEFGLRDDYSILREAHEDPGKVLRFTASHGRPVYGWLLEQSFSRFDRLADLQWGRLAAALSVGGAAALMAWVMVRRLGWSSGMSVATAAGVVALPGAQVLVSWSICWPHALAAVGGVVAFALAETGLAATRRWVATWWVVAAVGVLVLTALIYPPSSLLYVALIAAGWTGWGAWPAGMLGRRALFHFALLGGGLAAAFLVMKGAFAAGWFVASSRFTVDLEWWSKLQWMAVQPLVDGLALFVLRDFWGRAFGVYLSAVFVVVTVLVMGGWGGQRRRGGGAAVSWFVFLALCLAGALMVTFLASERWAPYRTLLALSAVVWVGVVQALGMLIGGGAGRRALTVALAVGAVGVLSVARWQARTLIAEPQAVELAVLRQGAASVSPGATQRVFFLRPTLWDSPAATVCFDEFGSLSTNSEWTPGEMLKAILRERPGAGWGVPWRTQVGSHWWLRPGAAPWDVVIDLRAIRGGWRAGARHAAGRR